MSVEEAVQELGKYAKQNGLKFFDRQSVDYDWAREISNSRIRRFPAAVIFPKEVEQVAHCVRTCKDCETPFRVQSGGHHHEGMSSISHGVVIRLSESNNVERVGDDKAWIGVGTPLQKVYDELQKINKTIPGGGCQTVNIGGLTLGGGWGTSVRKMGLTCDNFEEAEMVDAEGKILQVREKNKDGTPHKNCDLFWALRGGGGGNFGIVTRFLFRLWDIGPQVSTFSMQWHLGEPSKMVSIVQDYLERQAEFPKELTTAMGLRVKHRFMEKGKYYPISLAGKYYGPVEKLKAEMASFASQHKPAEIKFTETQFKPKKRGALVEGQKLSGLISEVVDIVGLGPTSGELSEPRPMIPSASTEALAGAAAPTSSKEEDYQVKPPQVTCSDPWPHKISSGYPADPDRYPAIAKEAIQILLDTNNAMPNNAARLYMVLHSMPGKQGGIGREETAYNWRDKDFLVQFQAWWSKPDPKALHGVAKSFEAEQQGYIDWIRGSRARLESELEGAFINFVDQTIPLKKYYGENYDELRRVKAKYDENNVFNFPMSIPSAKRSAS